MGMNILYGVVGEGMGHATRSSVIIQHLLERGHRVKVLASSRAYDFLAARFQDVDAIQGLHLVYEDNTIRKAKTLLSNLIAMPKNITTNIGRYFHLVGDFKPDLVISDFDSFTYLYAKRHNIPVISIDNMQAIDRCIHPDLPRYERPNYRLTKTFIKGKLPHCDHYLISAFAPMLVRKARTSLVPPILRPEILKAQAKEGDHILVYQTSPSFQNLLPALQDMKGVKFKVYGLRRREDLGNVQLYDFDETGFINDLASAKAVIANGGYSLMSEAIYLKKPMLCVPVAGQFEQTFNGVYLQSQGYGEVWDGLDPDLIVHFIQNLSTYRRALSQHNQVGNDLLFAKLDQCLAKIASGIRHPAGDPQISMDWAA